MSNSHQSKFTTKTIHEISMDELDKVFEAEFGRTFDIVREADGQIQNDSSHSCTVNGKIFDFDEETLQQIITGEYENTGFFPWEMLLDELCRRGKIKAGDYLVEVMW